MSVILVRHGSTDANSEDVIRGWRDEPLNADGKAQAQKLAKKYGKKSVAAIYSSDLSRALDCAKAISATTGIRVQPTKLLRTWGRGELEGKKTSDVQKQIDDFIRRPNVVPRGGESWNQFIQRWIGALSFIMQSAKEYGDTLVVTHLTCVIAAKDWIKAGCPHDATRVDYRDPDLKSVDLGDDYIVPSA